MQLFKLIDKVFALQRFLYRNCSSIFNYIQKLNFVPSFNSLNEIDFPGGREKGKMNGQDLKIYSHEVVLHKCQMRKN